LVKVVGNSTGFYALFTKTKYALTFFLEKDCINFLYLCPGSPSDYFLQLLHKTLRPSTPLPMLVISYSLLL